MQLFKETNIDFLKYKIPAILVSALIIIAGLALIAKNGLRYGVDFSGGTAIHVKFRKPVPLDSIRKILKDNGYHDSGVQGYDDETQVLVRLPQKVSSADQVGQLTRRITQLLSPASSPDAVGRKDLNAATETELRQYILLKDPWGVRSAEKYQPEIIKLRKLKQENTGLFPAFDQMKGIDPKIVSALREDYYVSDLAILSTEYVGPQVGSELRSQAKLAVIWSLVGLLIYTWFRFQLVWGLAAVVCLAHDVLIALAFFAFFGREISLTVIAAFLTIVGFSLNDTIVIYDRVRDNLKTMRTQPLEHVINLSLNQMLSRTILTNGTVLSVVMVLYVFGGEVINDFAFAMLVGCISGAYSTVYIASALIVFYERYFGKKKKAQPVKTKVSQKVS